MSMAERIIVHESQLDRPIERGRFVYAFCHIHGSDNQPSLHINIENGFGKCHACPAQVFVPEYAPDGGASYAAAKARPWRAPSVEKLLTPRVRREMPREPEPSTWQLEEVVALQRLYERMQKRLKDDRALLYLWARGIPANVVAEMGAGYIPADAPVEGRRDPDGKTRLYIAGTSLSAKWRDRLVFPLASPAGFGFYGRSLHGWEPGGDVNAHAAWLKDKARDAGDVYAWGHCHEKTYPAGWFNWEALATATHVVLVEGVFDALALIAAGVDQEEVVALVGTAAQPEWVRVEHAPYLHLGGVVLALDYDKAEAIEAAGKLERELRRAGLRVTPCQPPQDGQGKDWSERWRSERMEGVWPVLGALDGLAGGDARITVMTSTQAEALPMPAPAIVATPAADPPASVPWLEDPLVQFLLRRGCEIVEARMLEPLEPAAVAAGVLWEVSHGDPAG